MESATRVIHRDTEEEVMSSQTSTFLAVASSWGHTYRRHYVGVRHISRHEAFEPNMNPHRGRPRCGGSSSGSTNLGYGCVMRRMSNRTLRFEYKKHLTMNMYVLWFEPMLSELRPITEHPDSWVRISNAAMRGLHEQTIGALNIRSKHDSPRSITSF